MLSPEYVAGFFDGEGCVNITVRGEFRQVCLRVMVANTEPTILAALCAQFGGCLNKPQRHNKRWKQSRQWSITGHGAIRFLSVIRPYSRIKSAQIDLAFEFFRFMSLPKNERCHSVKTPTLLAPWHTTTRRTPDTIAREMEFKSKMHGLNRKGAA